MSIYLQSLGDDSERVHLERWSIRERNDNGERRVVGFSRETRDGRVSTPIVELNAEARGGRTASGRTYHLVGPSGWSSDGEYVFNRVVNILGGRDAWRDVTAELIPDCSASNPELSIEATARALFVSRSYVRRLVDEGGLPAYISNDGLPRIPLSAVQAFREKMRAEQEKALISLMDASQRLGLYDAETEDLPVRRKSDDDKGEE